MIYLTKAEHEELLQARRERDELRGREAGIFAALRELEQDLRHPWARTFIDRITQRAPDVVIGGEERPYLRRWWVIPRNPIFNVYLHQFMRSDDDRALHDHPWANLSILLRGRYVEHTIAAGGIAHRRELTAGDWRLRWTGRLAHRIELTDGPCWTLFVTGPRYREWGFHCADRWIPWKQFTAADDPGSIGRGCDQ